MKYVIPIMVCALVFLLPTCVSAQDSSVTIEVAAKAFMDATREGAWARCAKLTHPDALKQIRGLFGPIIADLKTEKYKQTMEFSSETKAQETEKTEPLRAKKPARKP